jgi:hypothetical protein
MSDFSLGLTALTCLYSVSMVPTRHRSFPVSRARLESVATSEGDA